MSLPKPRVNSDDFYMLISNLVEHTCTTASSSDRGPAFWSHHLSQFQTCKEHNCPRDDASSPTKQLAPPCPQMPCGDEWLHGVAKHNSPHQFCHVDIANQHSWSTEIASTEQMPHPKGWCMESCHWSIKIQLGSTNKQRGACAVPMNECVHLYQRNKATAIFIVIDYSNDDKGTFCQSLLLSWKCACYATTTGGHVNK